MGLFRRRLNDRRLHLSIRLRRSFGQSFFDLAGGAQIVVYLPRDKVIDVLAHDLVRHKHDDRDRCDNQRVLGHRLALGEFLLELAQPDIELAQHFHLQLPYNVVLACRQALPA